jgi:cyclopropane fatty-acyl-phospholipid synthase-like methyltransferase
MPKNKILFHGRHLLHTTFQEQALGRLARRLKAESGEVEVVFAVTSANHANSRFNPVPFHYRSIGIDLFAREVLEPIDVRWHIIPIPHLSPTERFADRIISHAKAASEGALSIGPENTVVFCSTVPLIEQFNKLGFEVDAAEYDPLTRQNVARVPQDILKAFAARMKSWATLPLSDELSGATRKLWRTYPEIAAEIERLWNEQLLTEHGDLTETRDYGTYSFSMSKHDVIDHKYKVIKSGIVPGVIVDEGCADGALLVRIAKDFPDSDLIGIEITREFLAEARERVRRGEFGNSFVFLHQRNLAHKIFDDASVNTTICNSTTHEIWSYGGGDETLKAYLKHKYAQLRPEGALVIRDVVGPESGEQEIYAWFNDADGITPAPADVGKYSVRELSTRGRFYRFAKEFLNGRGVDYAEAMRDGKPLIRAKRKDIADFLSKKSYVDNWDSELHESFTHWPYSRWKAELEAVGFSLDEGLSKAYVNEWIVEKYIKGTARLYAEERGELVDEPFPPTNIILVARKQ